MQLNPGSFNKFLNGMGQTTLWRPAIDCPCRNPYSGAADQTCTICQGAGQAWGDPVEGTVALSGQSMQREWASFGLWESGDLVVTLPSDSPLYAMGEFDRVIFTDSSEPFSITRIHGKSGVLPFSVVSFDRCVVRLVDNNSMVLDDIATPMLDDDNMPTWTTGAPGLLQQYTLSGRKHPEYYTYGNFPQDRAHHHGLDLPRKVILRRFDLFGRSS